MGGHPRVAGLAGVFWGIVPGFWESHYGRLPSGAVRATRGT